MSIRADSASREHLNLLLTVARRYYLDEANQAEIAREISFSRPTVSRLLAEARQRGIVRIEVGHPLARMLELEGQLVHAYGLRSAAVAEPIPGLQRLTAVAKLASEVIVAESRPDSVVGISNGSTLAAVVDQLPRMRRPETVVVQLIGALGQDNTLVDSPDLCRRGAEAFGGSYRIMPIPLVVGSARLAMAMRREASVATTLALGSHADVAVVGIGATDANGSGRVFEGWMTPQTVRELHRAGAVGHMQGHHFDRNGKHLTGDLCSRVMSVPLARLSDVATVIAVAFGPHKIAAIRGALRGHYVDILVTDDETALAVLQDS